MRLHVNSSFQTQLNRNVIPQFYSTNPYFTQAISLTSGSPRFWAVKIAHQPGKKYDQNRNSGTGPFSQYKTHFPNAKHITWITDRQGYYARASSKTSVWIMQCPIRKPYAQHIQQSSVPPVCVAVCNFFYLLFFLWLDSRSGPSLFYEVPRSYSDTPHSVGFLWTKDRPATDTSTCHTKCS